MMRPRLEAVREVLAPHGAVFVSIDDNEAAHLRLLMDEVFGEANFLAQVVVNLNPKGRQLGRGFATSHEYVLAYARHLPSCAVDGSVDRGRRRVRLPAGHARRATVPLPAAAQHQQEVQPGHRTPTLHFPLHGDPVTGRVAVSAFDGSTALTPVFGDGRPAVWRWSRPRVDERPDDLECRVIRGRSGERVDIFQRDWLHREGGRRKKLRTIWLAEEIGSTDTAVAELKAARRPRLRVAQAHRPGPPDPGHACPPTWSCSTRSPAAAPPVTPSRSPTPPTAAPAAASASTPPSPPARAPTPSSPASPTVADITRARLAAVAEQVGGGLEVVR